MRNFKLIFTVFICILMMHTASVQAKEEMFENSMEDAIIIGIGLGIGGILGVSTLPWADEPKEHTKNIWMGMAVGTILAVGFVAYRQADTSKDSFESARLFDQRKIFGTTRRLAWHKVSHKNTMTSIAKTPKMLSYSFSF